MDLVGGLETWIQIATIAITVISLFIVNGLSRAETNRVKKKEILEDIMVNLYRIENAKTLKLQNLHKEALLLSSQIIRIELHARKKTREAIRMYAEACSHNLNAQEDNRIPKQIVIDYRAKAIKEINFETGSMWHKLLCLLKKNKALRKTEPLNNDEKELVNLYRSADVLTRAKTLQVLCEKRRGLDKTQLYSHAVDDLQTQDSLKENKGVQTKS